MTTGPQQDQTAAGNSSSILCHTRRAATRLDLTRRALTPNNSNLAANRRQNTPRIDAGRAPLAGPHVMQLTLTGDDDSEKYTTTSSFKARNFLHSSKQPKKQKKNNNFLQFLTVFYLGFLLGFKNTGNFRTLLQWGVLKKT